MNKSDKKYILVVVLILILITFLTNYEGATDIFDYSGTAKFLAGEYSADIRSSHSYFFGFLHSPFLKIMGNFIIFKITSLIFLLLIVYSVYIISGKNKKTLWLMLLSPVTWYMAPWISPIQLASLILLWAWYFIVKYNNYGQIKYLCFSGLLIGLGWAIWDTILYFGIFLAIAFLYNKKASHLFYLLIFVFIGLVPRLILNQFLFNFAFFDITKSVAGQVIRTYFGDIYAGESLDNRSILNFVSLLLAIPFYIWILYKPIFFKQNKKTIIFLSLSFLLILTNLQIRFTLALLPIMFILLGRRLNENQFKKQIILFFVIIVLFTIPYIIHIGYSIDKEETYYTQEFTYYLKNIRDIKLSSGSIHDKIIEDLNNISSTFPHETFVVGNRADTYRVLAHLYWGDNIKEFVSIQDYNLALDNQSVIFKKRFESDSSIQARRQIWIEGGISKNPNDGTNYKDINFAIGLLEPPEVEGFEIIEKYNILYLSKKIK